MATGSPSDKWQNRSEFRVISDKSTVTSDRIAARSLSEAKRSVA